MKAKIKITAIAAGMLIAAAGTANAAEVLNVSQMDAVTAGGGKFDHKYGDYWRGKSFHDKHGRKYWYGHWKWRGKDYDFKCKDERGQVSYGNVVKVEDKKDNNANIPNNNTNTANVKTESGNTVVVQLAGVSVGGNLTVNVTLDQTQKINNFDITKINKNYYYPKNIHSSYKR
jgi:hypothetical protein